MSTSTQEAPPPKYLLLCEREGESNTVLFSTQTRPKQSDIIGLGYGVYHLCRGDGSVIKTSVVEPNRNGKPRLTNVTPDVLQGARTLHLERMVRNYTVIVKHWPAKQRDLKQLTTELQRRASIFKVLAETGETCGPLSPGTMWGLRSDGTCSPVSVPSREES